jgi:hypothetical protein
MENRFEAYRLLPSSQMNYPAERIDFILNLEIEQVLRDLLLCSGLLKWGVIRTFSGHANNQYVGGWKA